MDPRTKRYLDALTAVREVLNDVDPEGLIAGRAPLDGYDHQAGALVRLVLRNSVTQDAVATVWNATFDPAEKEGFDGRWSSVLTTMTTRLAALSSRFSSDS
jgi:hypothetical protein